MAAKKKRKTKKAKDAPPMAERFAEAGGARMVMGVAMILAVAAGLTFGVSRLEARSRTLLLAEEVSFAWPVLVRIQTDDGLAAWPPREVQQRLLDMAQSRAAQYPDPLAGDSLRAIGEDMLATGLFERLDAVKRTPGADIEIQGVWRRPVGAVRHDGQDHLVGPGGEYLPVRYEPGRTSMRVILGAAFNPPIRRDGAPAYGAPWPGEDVGAGLRVLEQLRGKPYWSQVSAVDVSGHALNQRIEIITDRGTRVVWGAAPGVFRPGEVDTQAKLGHLQALFERFGRIDAGQNRVTVFYEYTDVDRSASSGQ